MPHGAVSSGTKASTVDCFSCRLSVRFMAYMAGRDPFLAVIDDGREKAVAVALREDAGSLRRRDHDPVRVDDIDELAFAGLYQPELLDEKRDWSGSIWPPATPTVTPFLSFSGTSTNKTFFLDGSTVYTFDTTGLPMRQHSADRLDAQHVQRNIGHPLRIGQNDVPAVIQQERCRR